MIVIASIGLILTNSPGINIITVSDNEGFDTNCRTAFLTHNTIVLRRHHLREQHRSFGLP
jgi:hypothetical protein